MKKTVIQLCAFLLLLSIAGVCVAQPPPPAKLRVEQSGGSPTGKPSKLVFSGCTVTYVGSVATVSGCSGSVAESSITFTDITTNNATTSVHGFLKKLDGTATHYMDGTGAWSTPAGTPGGSSGTVQYNNAGAFGGVSGLTLTTGTLTQIDVGNLRATGNTISSTNANGDVVVSPNGTGGLSVVTGANSVLLKTDTNGDLIVRQAGDGAYAGVKATYAAAMSGANQTGISYSGAAVGGPGFLGASDWKFGWSSSSTSWNNPDVALVRSAAGVIKATDGSSGSGWIKDAGNCYVAADQTSTSATLGTTTCSITLLAARAYAGVCEFFLTDSVAADGAKIDFNGGAATTTTFRAQVTAFDSALNLSSQGTAISTAYTATTFTGAGAFEVHLFILSNGAGTFIPRFAQSAHTTGTLTLAAGSHCTLKDVT